MEKTTLIAVVLATLLIGGVVLASAAFLQEDELEGSETQVVKQPQPTCGPRTCDGQCGGNCGIPTCGCGR